LPSREPDWKLHDPVGALCTDAQGIAILSDVPANTDLISATSFRIITDNPAKLLEHGSLAIAANSRANPEVIHNDVAAFRLFAPTPAVFPSVAGEQ
jgi:hypothetical protein